MIRLLKNYLLQIDQEAFMKFQFHVITRPASQIKATVDFFFSNLLFYVTLHSLVVMHMYVKSFKPEKTSEQICAVKSGTET